MLSESWSEKIRWIWLKGWKEASSITRAHSFLEENGEHQDVERRGLPQARADLDVVVGHVGQQDRLLSSELCRTRPRELELVRDVLSRVRVAREQLQVDCSARRGQGDPADQRARRLHPDQLGLGEATPLNILVFPVLFEDEVRAVIGLPPSSPSARSSDFPRPTLGEHRRRPHMISANMRTEELLNQSQSLAQELQTQSKELQQQQAELKRSNSELEAQAKSLKTSEELLKDQQEELQQINEELKRKRRSSPSRQSGRAEESRGRDGPSRPRREASQLALSSKYKSESC